MRAIGSPSSPTLKLVQAICVSLFCVGAVASSAQTFTSLHSFDGATEGGNPWLGPLVQGADGKLYGTTFFGGTNDVGTVYKITRAGALTVLHTFTGSTTDGANPSAGLALGPDGNFYGTSVHGGASGNGVVYKITPSGTLTVLHSFNFTDGQQTHAGLYLGADGVFYGTATDGGTGPGTLFSITPSGQFTLLHSFTGTEGGAPWAAPILGSDGNLYGTLYSGGQSGFGSVYQFTSNGTLNVLHYFNDTDGGWPSGQLTEGPDGAFYGTTQTGGAHVNGTVFKVTSTGVYTLLYSFCSQTNCADGIQPWAGLIQGRDGNFYGTTSQGGRGGGSIFRITPDGVETTLYALRLQDGSFTYGGLLQAGDGNFYGTTYQGSQTSYGTVYTLSGPQRMVAVAPCRVVDTRGPNGTFGGPPIQGNQSRSFPIPQGGCSIPAGAAAYSLNVTVVPRGQLGYLTIWPTGENQPLVSTMNSPDGRVKANAAIVPAGDQGAVSVYVTDTSDVILDIDGYFGAAAENNFPAQSSLQFYPVTPCRVVDTRQTNFPQGLGPPSFGSMETRSLPVLSSPCLQGLPNQPAAYSFNATVVPQPAGHPLGYLTLWPTAQQQPVVSTLNNPTATVVANAAIVPAGSNGAISAFTYDSTDLILDINGYFAAPAQNGLSFYPVAPCRPYDSRNNNGQPFRGTRTLDIVDSVCGPPSSAQAYVFNATVVPTNGPMGYLTLWPDGENQPTVSTLNAYDGFVTSNMAIVPNANGSIDVYADGLTHLIMDISGYFAP